MSNELPQPSMQTLSQSCSNFVIGAWDMCEYLSWRDIFVGNNPSFCPPQEPVDITQPILVFVNYIEEHPEKMDHRLAMVLEWSFKRAYPCTDAFYMSLGQQKKIHIRAASCQARRSCTHTVNRYSQQSKLTLNLKDAIVHAQ